MLALIAAIVQFALNLTDPQQACSITHREPDVAGTFYLYCAQTADGVEMATVGRFISDAKTAGK